MCDELTWLDVMSFTAAVINREELRRKEKIADYIMMINILHSQPERLLDELSAALMPETGGGDDDIGEMDKLRRLKKRGGGRHDGR